MSEFGGRGSGVGDRGSGIGLPADARSGKAGDRLDTAIDLAVREMLDVEPPPGLRGRVLDGIDANSAVPAFGLSTNAGASSFGLSTNPVVSAFRRKMAWATVPLATAAIITLAVLAPWRPAAPPLATSAPPSIARVEPPPAVVAPPASPRTTETSRQTPTRVPRSQPPAGRRPSRGDDERIVVAVVAADDDTGIVIEPLAPIAPIVAAGTHPQDIVPKEIAVSPMAPIVQLQIAPLSPPERRN